MILPILLKPLALSFLIQFTAHHFTHKDHDDSYDPTKDNFQQNNPDFEEVLDTDELPPLFVRPEVLLPPA